VSEVLGPDEVELSDWSDDESVSSHVNVYGAGGFVQSTDYAALPLISPKSLLRLHHELDIEAEDGETPSAGGAVAGSVHQPFWAISPPSLARAVSPIDRGRRSVESRSPTRSSYVGSYTPSNPLEDYAAARTRRSMHSSPARRRSPSAVRRTPEPPSRHDAERDDAGSDSSDEGGVRIPTRKRPQRA